MVLVQKVRDMGYRYFLPDLVERDKSRCRMCGIKLDYFSATIDHIIPKSLGGSDELENLQLACRKCNARKHTKYEQKAKNKEDFLRRYKMEVPK